MRHLWSGIFLTLALIAAQAQAAPAPTRQQTETIMQNIPSLKVQKKSHTDIHKRAVGPAKHKRSLNSNHKTSVVNIPDAKGVIAPVFKMNTDSMPYNEYCWDATGAMLKDGTIISVWGDYRSGWQKIFFQRVSAHGQSMGPVSQATDEYYYQQYPVMAADANGEFILAWEDLRSGTRYDIYCRRFDAGGNPLDTAFRVSDYDEGDAFDPAITAIDSGYAVTWNDNRTGTAEVYLQLIDSLGALKGAAVRVNEETAYYQQRSSVASIGQGFVVVWQDARSGNDADIYARRYNSNGDALGPEFKVSDNSTNRRYYPEVCGTDSGFTVTWYDTRNSICDVYLQRFDTAGTAVGANYRVTDGSGYGFYPTIAHYQGLTAVSWYDDRSGDLDIYAQWFKPNGDTLGGQVLINDDTTNTAQYMPKAMAGDSGWAFLWADQRESDASQIYCQGYDSSLAALTSNFRACDSLFGLQDQYEPSVAAGQDGNFLVVWYDYRNDDGNNAISDIYGRLYDKDGNALTDDFLVSDTSYNSSYRYVYEPKVAGLADGSYMVAWYDYRNDTDYDIFGQRVNANGSLSGGNQLISTGRQGLEDYELTITASDSGYGVFWYGDNSTDYDIFGRVYKTNGDSVGPMITVTDDSSGQEQRYPCAAANDSGLIVAWDDYRDMNYTHIYGQRIRWDGGLAGGNFLISDSLDYDQEDVSIAGTNQGFLATWDDDRAGMYNVYGQYLSATGQREDASFVVGTTPGIDQYCATVGVSPDGGRYVVYWNGEDSDYNDYLFSQRYQNRLPQGVNELLADSIDWDGFYLWGAQNMAASDDRLFFALCGRMKGTNTGWDAYGMVTDWYSLSTSPAVWVDSLPDDIDSAYGPYPVNAVITDDGSVDRAVLYYRINGGSWDTLSMTLATADTFRAEIPEQFLTANDSVTISYYVWALDNAKNWTTSPIRSFLLSWPSGVAGKPEISLPTIYALGNAYPNPSRGNVTIKYQLPKESKISLTIYNVVGQQIKHFDIGTKPAGYHQISWSDNTLPNGVYIYQLKAGTFTSTKKLMVVR